MMKKHTSAPQNTSTEHQPSKHTTGRTTPTSAPQEPIKPLPETTVTAILDRWPPEMSLDQSMVLVQKLIAMAAMEREVEELCGARYTHGGPSNHRYQRYGFNPGAIRIRSQWVRVQIPRVRDTQLQQEKRLKRSNEKWARILCSYFHFHQTYNCIDNIVFILYKK